jgi:hypothetical protein
MKDLALWAVARLREPSTYNGLGMLIGAMVLKFGLHLSPEDQASWAKDIAEWGMATAGLVAMGMKDAGGSWR